MKPGAGAPRGTPGPGPRAACLGHAAPGARPVPCFEGEDRPLGETGFVFLGKVTCFGLTPYCTADSCVFVKP